MWRRVLCSQATVLRTNTMEIVVSLAIGISQIRKKQLLLASTLQSGLPRYNYHISDPIMHVFFVLQHSVFGLDPACYITCTLVPVADAIPSHLISSDLISSNAGRHFDYSQHQNPSYDIQSKVLTSQRRTSHHPLTTVHTTVYPHIHIHIPISPARVARSTKSRNINPPDGFPLTQASITRHDFNNASDLHPMRQEERPTPSLAVKTRTIILLGSTH
jgi:hypothetical protein